jgi:capsular polysaccharide biosynthesis protein
MKISTDKLQVDWVMFNDKFRFEYAEIRKSDKKANLVESELKLKKTQPMWKAIAYNMA